MQNLPLSSLTNADQAAIARHLEWLRGEAGAVSLTATLPSGRPAEIFRDGTVKA